LLKASPPQENDGSNFLPWSIHVLDTFRAIGPLIEQVVDASISHPVVDWSNYRNWSKEDERYVQHNAQAINIILSTLSAEVRDEAIFNGQTPSESGRLIWTRLIGLYGKSKCDDAYELKTLENMSIVSSCSEEASRNLKSTVSEQEVQATTAVVTGCTYQTWPVALPDLFSMAEAAG
jgi:hypothetical protein